MHLTVLKIKTRTIITIIIIIFFEIVTQKDTYNFKKKITIDVGFHHKKRNLKYFQNKNWKYFQNIMFLFIIPVLEITNICT